MYSNIFVIYILQIYILCYKSYCYKYPTNNLLRYFNLNIYNTKLFKNKFERYKMLSNQSL